VTDRQTDGQTDRHPHRFMIWPHVVGHIINISTFFHHRVATPF